MDPLRMLGRNLALDRNRSMLSGVAVAAAIVLIVVRGPVCGKKVDP